MNTQQLLKNTEDKIERLSDEAKTAGHSVLMAGLGVFAEADEQGRSLFRDLVLKGREVQSEQKDFLEDTFGDSRQRVRRVAEWASGTLRESVDGIHQRSTEFLQRLGVPTYEDVRTLNQRVSELNEKVEALASR